MRVASNSIIIFSCWGWLASGQAGKKTAKLVDPPAVSAERAADGGSIPGPGVAGRPKAVTPLVSTEYRIGAGDVLEIIVWKEPDGSVPAITVRPDGNISVPFIGQVQAAGLIPVTLERLLSEKLTPYFRDPRITVLVKEVNSQKIYVIGEVKKEGAIRLQAPMTVLQALAEAGGITDYAKRSKIQVFRVEQQQQKVYIFDYTAVVRGQHVEQNFQVLPGDTIVVPR